MLTKLRDVAVFVLLVASFYGYFFIALDALEFETTGKCDQCTILTHLK